MCAVSMISEFYNQPTHPQPNAAPMPWTVTAPSTLPWTADTFQLLKEIMAKMKELDSKLGLKDCEDPKKAQWMKSIERRVEKVEQATRKTKRNAPRRA